MRQGGRDDWKWSRNRWIGSGWRMSWRTIDQGRVMAAIVLSGDMSAWMPVQPIIISATFTFNATLSKKKKPQKVQLVLCSFLLDRIEESQAVWSDVDKKQDEITPFLFHSLRAEYHDSCSRLRCICMLRAAYHKLFSVFLVYIPLLAAHTRLS